MPVQGTTGFKILSPAHTGIAFTNSLSERDAAANRVLLNGSGVAAGDFDRDGLPDLFFCGLATPNALYKNLGHWRFTNVTEQAGLRCTGRDFRGAVFADVNGDGWLDLLITANSRGVLCFLNDGNGKFIDATTAANLASKLGSTTLALADIDGNATLDLYVTNYRADDIRDRGQVELQSLRGNLTVPPALKNRLVVVNNEVLEYGETDQLFLNDGQGHFAPAPWTKGAFLDEDGKKLPAPPLDWGLSATFRDLNGDAAPDLYVCNDFWTPDRIWLNDGQGHFRALSALVLRNTSANSMGIDFADIDGDGHVDFFVVDMLSRDRSRQKRQSSVQPPSFLPVELSGHRVQFARNTLFRNRSDGTFEEIAYFSGVAASDWSWQPVFIDVDLDGYEDLLITAGHTKDIQDLDANAKIDAGPPSWRRHTNAVERQKAFTQQRLLDNRHYPNLYMPVVAFRNQGDLTFAETTHLWGTDQLGVHHGIALADLDSDGDLDFVVNNLGALAGVYRNDSSAPRVAVRLRGSPPNTQGIGAKVQLFGGPVPLQSREVFCGGQYLSGSEPIVVFAAGAGNREMSIEVTWRRGKRTVVRNIVPNRIYEIDEPTDQGPDTKR